MYCDLCNLYALLWPAFLVHCDCLPVIQSVPTLEDFAEDGVLPIEMRGCSKCHEELAAIGVWALVGHADYPPRIVPQRGLDLVLEELVRCVVYRGRGL